MNLKTSVGLLERGFSVGSGWVYLWFELVGV